MTKQELLEQNIQLLERGITLQEYVEKESELTIDGSTKIYNDYGFFVVYNKTKNLYVLDGGNFPTSFSMSSVLHNFFFNDHGNRYMNKHYIEGDDLILKFHKFDSGVYENLEKMETALTEGYNKTGKTYFDYIVQIRDGILPEEPPKDIFSYEFEPKSFSAKLVQLKCKSKFLYGILNFIVSMLVKALIISFFVYPKVVNTVTEENVVQKLVFLIITYIAAIILYLIYLGVVQILKLIFCSDKFLRIRIRVFDIIIGLSVLKMTGIKNQLKRIKFNKKYNNSKALKTTINEGERTEKRNIKISAYDGKKAKLDYLREVYEEQKDLYDYYLIRAEDEMKGALNGGGILESAETKRENAKAYTKKAERQAELLAETKAKIEELEWKIEMKSI